MTQGVSINNEDKRLSSREASVGSVRRHDARYHAMPWNAMPASPRYRQSSRLPDSALPHLPQFVRLLAPKATRPPHFHFQPIFDLTKHTAVRHIESPQPQTHSESPNHQISHGASIGRRSAQYHLHLLIQIRCIASVGRITRPSSPPRIITQYGQGPRIAGSCRQSQVADTQG